MAKNQEEQFDEKLEEVKTVKALTTKVFSSLSPFLSFLSPGAQESCEA